MKNAVFEGLTRIAAEFADPPGALGKSDLIIDNALSVSSKSDKSYWTIPESEIKSVAVSGNKAVISLTDSAFLGRGALRGRMAEDACVTVKGKGPCRVKRQGAAMNDAARFLMDPATNLTPGDENRGNSGRGCTYWLNMGNGQQGNPYRVDHGPDPAKWLNEGRRYSLVGMECNALLIVFDFPDAKGADNTGLTGLPGEAPEDRKNFVNGHRLKTARDYFDWVSGRNIAFMDEASFGNVKTTWTLLENSEPGSAGIYTLPYSLYPNSYYKPGGVIFEADMAAGKPVDYPWLSTNPEGWEGYWFARGGSTDNWNSGVLGYASAPGLRRDFDALAAGLPGGKANFTMGYWASVENAVGITYGQSFGGNGNIGPVLGLGGPKDKPSGPNGPGLYNFSFMGADSYNSFKYRHMTHELGHQMGLPDHYIAGRSGYADPYTGKSDTFSLTGGFDHMGQIIGVSPDFFAWIKWKYGWFRDDQTVILTENGAYNIELTPIETEGGTKLVVIPGETRGVVYCLEYRGGKLGVNNIEKTERSNDPFDPDLSKYGEQAAWDHSAFFGTDTQPGILMYRINSNDSAPAGHTVVMDLMPRSLDNKEKYDNRFCATLNKSLLGPASGVYKYTDASFGITVSVDPSHALVNGAAHSPYTVSVVKKTPGAKERVPVLANAEFVDMNTIQFTTNVDLRGLHASNFRVTRDGVAMVGPRMSGYDFDKNSAVLVNQLTSYSVRLTLPGAPFTYEDAAGLSGAKITVEIVEGQTSGTLYQYLPSASAVVAPRRDKAPVGVVALKNLRFTSLTTIAADADKDLSGFSSPARGMRSSAVSAAKVSLRIVKPDAKTVLSSEQIVSASYSRKTGLLTIEILPGIFKSLSETAGTSVEIAKPVSSYAPNVTNPPNPGATAWYHNVELNKTSAPAISVMAKFEDGKFGKNGEAFGAAFKIIGGGGDTPIKTKLEFSVSGASLSEKDALVVEMRGGNTVKKPLGEWFAAFASTHKYNGRDEFPMAMNSLELEFPRAKAKAGTCAYKLTLRSPDDNAVWAETSGEFTV